MLEICGLFFGGPFMEAPLNMIAGSFSCVKGCVSGHQHVPNLAVGSVGRGRVSGDDVGSTINAFLWLMDVDGC